MEFYEFARIIESVNDMSRNGWICVFKYNRIVLYHDDYGTNCFAEMEELKRFINSASLQYS